MTDNIALMNKPNERVLYLNGDYVPESRGFVHFRDRGFVYGDAVFDTARTFGGKLYRLEDHLDRLFRSLRYLHIDPGLTKADLAEISQEVVDRNRSLLAPNEDYWLSQRISRGNNLPDGPGGYQPTVIIETTPIPFAKRAVLYRDGAEVIVPTIRRTPPESLSPNAKMQNYLNLIVAGLEGGLPGGQPAGRSWPILLDSRGFLSEGTGSNIFLVRDGALLTPKAAYVLPGISRAVVIDLAARLDLVCREEDLSLYDATTADECFITSTSLCICPVASFNGQTIGDAIPGPVTQRLMNGFAQEVGLDFAEQYLSYLS